MSVARVTIVSRMPPDRARLVFDQAPGDFDVAMVESGTPLDKQVAACRDADAIVLGAPSVSPEVVRRCPSVKLVQTLSAGYEELDLEAITSLGVPVANNGGANATAVAEEVIGLMLLLRRGILRHLLNARAGRWREGIRDLPYAELSGSTVGIVGLGPIGREVAARLSAFGCELLYHDVTPASSDTERALGVTHVPLEELLRRSDAVTLHVPLTPGTRHMVGEAELAAMKPTAILVNASRGGIVDEGALYWALTSGRLAGAGLDVLEEEPASPDNPLLALDNVAVTAHMAGVTVESNTRAARFAFANVRRAVTGEPIESVVARPSSAPGGRADGGS